MEQRPPIVPCDPEACLAASSAASVFPMFNRMLSEAVNERLMTVEDAEKAVESINEVNCIGSRCMRLEFAADDLRGIGYFKKHKPGGGDKKKGGDKTADSEEASSGDSPEEE